MLSGCDPDDSPEQEDAKPVDPVPTVVVPVPTTEGGIITYSEDGNWVFVTFKDPGGPYSLTFDTDSPNVVADVLIVAGGGGGGGSKSGDRGGGGGGGGVLIGRETLTAKTTTVWVGSGGAGNASTGDSGGSSQFGGVIAPGGGGGGGGINSTAVLPGLKGGSGGGGGAATGETGGQGGIVDESETVPDGYTRHGYSGGRAGLGSSDTKGSIGGNANGGNVDGGGGGGGAGGVGLRGTNISGGSGGNPWTANDEWIAEALGVSAFARGGNGGWSANAAAATGFGDGGPGGGGSTEAGKAGHSGVVVIRLPAPTAPTGD
jgi:hypothetical protein